MAPTRIIYLIATDYILGFDEKLKAETHHFVQAGVGNVCGYAGRASAQDWSREKLHEIEVCRCKRMNNCDWCSLSEKDRQYQVYDGKSWSVFLSDEQDYIGRCILVLKRHCNSLSGLTEDEWDELRSLVCKVEACLKTVLGAALCNWSCLMNSFYKEAAPDPHLHIQPLF